jgi:hypothetical protein
MYSANDRILTYLPTGRLPLRGADLLKVASMRIAVRQERYKTGPFYSF